MTAYTIRSVIPHNTTTSLIDGVVRWLKTEPSRSDAEWQAHTDLVQGCLEEMMEMRFLEFLGIRKGELSDQILSDQIQIFSVLA